MSMNIGKLFKLSVFGESHGPAIGGVIDGVPAGTEISAERIIIHMKRRAPGRRGTTPRQEADIPEFLSGVYNGRATGAPICFIIRNQNTRSSDYEQLKELMRPGHSDYPAFIKYNGFNDYRGGGHFSGRITAPLVMAGSIARLLLQEQGVYIGAHLARVGKAEDKPFASMDKQAFEAVWNKDFPCVGDGADIKSEIERAAEEGDSLGGSIQCCVIGLPPGLGEPFFDSAESELAHIIFSVPGVKALSFGEGIRAPEMKGSEYNDQLEIKNGSVHMLGNNAGGINGGITNGMPVIFTVNMRPTPSIFKAQKTVNIKTMENQTLSLKGRHDPCIAVRAVPVIESAAAIVLYDLMLRAGRTSR